MGRRVSWRYIGLGIIRVGGGALRGNEDRVLRKMPHVSIEENQKGTSINARQAKEEGTEEIAKDLREGRENTGKNEDWRWMGEENVKN